MTETELYSEELPAKVLFTLRYLRIDGLLHAQLIESPFVARYRTTMEIVLREAQIIRLLEQICDE